jgi:hypothetical protein
VQRVQQRVGKRKQTNRVRDTPRPRERRHRCYPLLPIYFPECKATKTSRENSSQEDTNCHLFVDFHTFPLNFLPPLSPPTPAAVLGRDRVKLMDTKQPEPKAQTGQRLSLWYNIMVRRCPVRYIRDSRETEKQKRKRQGNVAWRLQETSCAGNIPRW